MGKRGWERSEEEEEGKSGQMGERKQMREEEGHSSQQSPCIADMKMLTDPVSVAEGPGRQSLLKKRKCLGMSRWLSRLSVRLLVSAQVLVL